MKHHPAPFRFPCKVSFYWGLENKEWQNIGLGLQVELNIYLQHLPSPHLKLHVVSYRGGAAA